MQDYTKQFTEMAAQFAEQVKSTMPKVTINKNGYEIRTEVLDMAKQFTESSYSAKLHGWNLSSEGNGNEVVTKVNVPEVPGVDQVLETAQKFYDFINQGSTKK